MFFTKSTSCRSCQSKDKKIIHDFGIVPLADKLTKTKGEQVESAQLSVSFCENCKLFQINEDVDPEILFKHNYPYLSSNIPEVDLHFFNFSEQIKKDFELNPDSVILEIAGNDGVLLKNFLDTTHNLYNVEPSISPALISDSQKINTIREFFSEKIAKNLSTIIRPNLIIACNVLAHVPNPNDFVAGLKKLSTDTTTIIIEVPHLLPMLQNTFFDVIFHQHYSYFSLLSINKIFNNNGLYVNKVQKLQTQGGTIRLFINTFNKQDNSISRMLKEELAAGLNNKLIFNKFSDKILKIKKDTIKVLKKIKSDGFRLVGYGAPGKAATLLNYFEIDNTLIDYLVDISPSKHNLFFPNTNLKIFPTEKLFENEPDYILILAWNYKDSIVKELKEKFSKEVKYISIYPIISIE